MLAKPCSVKCSRALGYSMNHVVIPSPLFASLRLEVCRCGGVIGKNRSVKAGRTAVSRDRRNISRF